MRNLLLILLIIPLKLLSQNIGNNTKVNSKEIQVNLPCITFEERQDQVSPTPGAIVYQTNGNKGLYFYDGNNWLFLNLQINQPDAVNEDSPSNNRLQENVWEVKGDNIYSLNKGNVGIGVTNPRMKLEILGNSLFNGELTANKILRGKGGLDISGTTSLNGKVIINNPTSQANFNVKGSSLFEGPVEVKGYNNILNVSGSSTFNGSVTISKGLKVSGYDGISVNISSGSSSGDVHVSLGGKLVTSTSDIRLKERILPLSNTLQKVLSLQGISYSWKDDKNQNPRLGFIAQDVEKVFPELVFTNSEDGYKGLFYGEFSSVLVEAIKEQQKQIEELRKEISEIKKIKQ